MPSSNTPRELWDGKHLRMLSRGGWEYVQRKHTTGIVVLVAVTAAREILLVEQYRPPVDARVIELPAGLAGDVLGAEDEPLEEAARRELLEETGYRADRLRAVTSGPVSAGLSTELITVFVASGVTRVAEGGGDAGEDITVHAVPLDAAEDWLAERQAAGALVDAKVYAGLYFAKDAT